MKILIADDDKLHRDKLKKFFSKFANVYDTDDGKLAVSLFKHHMKDKKFDLVVLDNLMPYCGMDTLDDIRKEEGTVKDSPAVIFMVSGFEDIDEKKEAYKKRANEYFVKGQGCTPAILKEAMKKHGLIQD
ncbi:MAG: response regulator [Candidatus Magnetobacterium sp. LHC-1]|uniref:Response regulator n=1 Tax=Candidatus Magnetobacterium casense TaxID=1455061 RepID=A0ABS6RUG3_9BACT|nr:response regulator [Candidatus Magnetobacterium casensis]MBV6340260.1 response regulator [Candidatus Magnetobacterium casensis]